MLSKDVKIFVVGGFVRDHILGVESKDRDFVVVGATSEMMLDNGFKQVGADFPVFLHPVTSDEFALARKERKVAAGHHGFEVDFDPTVTLEEDLMRRDLTINAMAMEVQGWDGDRAILCDDVIDPFNGQDDITNGILRPVSDSFKEDPVRVLRAARFSARLGFDWSDELKAMVKDIIDSGELEHLVAERVWQEMSKMMNGDKHASLFFERLSEVGALKVIMPEISKFDNLDLIMGEHGRMMLLTSHMDSKDIIRLCKRLKAPTSVKRVCVSLSKSVKAVKGMTHIDADTLMQVLDIIDVQRSGANDVLDICGVLRILKIRALSPRMVSKATDIVNEVTFADLQDKTLKGVEIKHALRKMRIEKLENFIKGFYNETKRNSGR